MNKEALADEVQREFCRARDTTDEVCRYQRITRAWYSARMLRRHFHVGDEYHAPGETEDAPGLLMTWDRDKRYFRVHCD